MGVRNGSQKWESEMGVRNESQKFFSSRKLIINLKKIVKRMIGILRILLMIYILTWIIKGSILDIYYITSNSMSSLILRGDYLVGIKFPYRTNTPEYFPLTENRITSRSYDGFIDFKTGDIVIFYDPLFADKINNIKPKIVKRIFATAGERVTIDSTIVTGTIYDDEEIDLVVPYEGMRIFVDESNYSYVKKIIKYSDPEYLVELGAHYVFTEDYYFVLGDNSNSSVDSRYFGPIPGKFIVAKAHFRFRLNSRGNFFDFIAD